MLAVFSSIFVANTKITVVYNFVAPLNNNSLVNKFDLLINKTKEMLIFQKFQKQNLVIHFLRDGLWKPFL